MEKTEERALQAWAWGCEMVLGANVAPPCSASICTCAGANEVVVDMEGNRRVWKSWFKWGN